MLPNILDVAQAYGLTFHPKQYGKKETLAKCPFCRKDAQPTKRKKYYLSLNTEDNVFKCWFCRESGGVLQFEVKLSGKSYDEVKKKYFGIRKKQLHPAYSLNPDQLEQIGWKTYKRDHFKGFQQNRAMVMQDWSLYVRKELARHYAMFICIAHLENQEQRKLKLLTWFIKKCWGSPIPGMYSQIQKQFLKEETLQKSWAKEGTTIARIAWRTSIKTLDVGMEELIPNMLFIEFFMKLDPGKTYLDQTLRSLPKSI